MRDPIVGLSRYEATESSVSDLTVFGSIEAAIEKHFRVERLPPYARMQSALSAEQLHRYWWRFMESCDVVITDNGFAAHLRSKTSRDCRILFIPLGALPRGHFPLAVNADLRRGDCVTFSSRADLQIFDNLVECSPAQRVVIPFGVDERAFSPSSPRDRQAWRQDLGLRDDDVLFLYAGRIFAEKNVQAVISVLDELSAQNEHAHLLVVGNIVDRPFWEFGTGPHDLAEHFRSIPRNRKPMFIEHLNRELLPLVYGVSDVFVNLTVNHDENFGFGQVEAMACGLPVICTDWGGLKDTVIDGETGFRVRTSVTERGIQVDRWSALQACDRLANSLALRQQMGNAGRRRVLAEYTNDRFAERWAALIRGSVEGSGEDSFQLTEFGRAFQDEFCGRAPRFITGNYHLYRRLIGPYASIELPAGMSDDTVVYLQPLALELRDRTLEVRDVLWPGVYDLDETQHGIVSALLHQRSLGGTLTVDEIVRRLHISSSVQAGDAAAGLSALSRRGLVGLSPKQLSVGEGAGGCRA